MLSPRGLVVDVRLATTRRSFSLPRFWVAYYRVLYYAVIPIAVAGRDAMKPKNLLILMSAQHSRALMGCYGHRLARTPNLDALPARRTRFPDCWTPSPSPAPARASSPTSHTIPQLPVYPH